MFAFQTRGTLHYQENNNTWWVETLGGWYLIENHQPLDPNKDNGKKVHIDPQERGRATIEEILHENM